MDEHGKHLGDDLFHFQESTLVDSDAVIRQYLHSCIPFPAAFYRNCHLDYSSMVEPCFGSFADGLFFIDLAKHGPIKILSEPLYRYRKHPGQMSTLQSRRAEFRFLMELVRRASPGFHRFVLKRASERATQASLNDLIDQRHIDSLAEQRNEGLPFSPKTLFHKPKLLIRAITTAMAHPKCLRPSGAQEILRFNDSPNENVNLIVFSKDRPLQLAGLLKSIQIHAQSPIDVQVLWKASQKEIRQAYDVVQQEFPGAKWVEERDFNKDLKALVSQGGGYLAFGTDDSLFFQPFRLEGVAGHPRVVCFSTRLGLNTKKCYTSNRDSELPQIFCDEKILLWKWGEATDDFAYPMSLDGHIFRKSFFLAMLDGCEFSNPNELEDCLARKAVSMKIKDTLPVWMASYRTSRYVSIPVNRIQNTFSNRAGNRPEFSSSSLLGKYQQGLRIDIDQTVSCLPNAAHQEFDLFLARPNTLPGT